MTDVLVPSTATCTLPVPALIAGAGNLPPGAFWSSSPSMLWDWAFIAVMAYSFALISAVGALKVENYYPQQKRW